MNSSFVRYAGAILFAFLLQACGGGGGGGAGGGIGGTSDTMVSGSVKAPAGLVASLQQDDWATQLASLFISSSHASIAGLANVPDGTVVELVRVDAVSGATVGTPLATTGVSGGHYSFNLTRLGLAYSTTLQARLASSTGVQMRTFVAGAVANIDPNSEAGIQLVLERIAAKSGSSLDTMTIKDLDDIVASVEMVASAAGITAGTTTVATVDAIKTRLNAKPELATLLDTKLSAGHAASGPGDIANYFPLAAGDSWTYSISMNGASATTAEILTVGTAMLRSGTLVMPVSAGLTTFPLPSAGSQTPTYQDTDYYLKDAAGLVSYGNSADPAAITALAPAYRLLKLPVKVGDTLVSVDQTASSAIGQDMDGDGISEILSRYKIDSLITGYQDITVPAGSFRCLVVEFHVMMTLRSSRNSNVTVTANITSTWFLAPDVGPVRTVDVLNGTASNGAVMPQSTIRHDLVDATVAGLSIKNRPPQGTEVKTVALLHNDLVYDKTRNRLYASVPSTASNGNSIAVINPDTGAIVQTVAVGPEPMQLALSKGDEYLYAGLDGSGELARVDLATMAVDLKFSLGTTGQLFAQDIAVMPGNPQSIVVARKLKNTSPAFQGIVIYDNATKRANEIPGWTAGAASIANAIAISDDGTFAYGINNETTGFELSRFSIAPTGLALLDKTNDLAGGWQTQLRMSDGRLYLTNGRVIDPANKVLVGIYPHDTYQSQDCIPDLSTTRTYCLAVPYSPTSTMISLVSFDRALFAQLATVETRIQAAAVVPGTMVRFGARGFAIGGSTTYTTYPPYDSIFLITSDIAL